MNGTKNGLGGKPLPLLKKDVRLLTTLLGDVIREQEGERIFQKVERIREFSKKIRVAHNPQLIKKQQTLIRSLNLSEAYKIARAFTIYFQLVNIAEEAERARRIRAYDTSPTLLQEMSLRKLFHDLKQKKFKTKEVAALLSRMDIRLVLTAHPTEVKRRTVLNHLLSIASRLAEYNRADTSEFEKREITYRIKETLEILWHTAEVRRRKVNVLDELNQTLFYFRRTILNLLPRVHKTLKGEFQHFFDKAPDSDFDCIRFGSWVGADRDGNKNVTCAVTREAARRQKRFILRTYLAAVERLMVQMSHSRVIVPVAPALLRSLSADRKRFPSLARELGRFEADEVYRKKFSFIYRRLGCSLDGRRGGYSGHEEFLEDLLVIRKSFEKNKGYFAARGDLGKLISQVRLFGFHLASLDFRDHSRKVRQAVAEIFPREVTDERFLVRMIAAGRYSLRGKKFSKDSKDILEQFSTLKELQEKVDRNIAENYILSMSEKASDMLALLCLAGAAGLLRVVRGKVTESRIGIVPLFESIDALERSHEVMERLFTLPIYRSYLATRGNRQEIMLGYSDSCKDGGYVAANWKLYCAEKRLAKTAKRHGVKIVFFHGKGGTIDRGGGGSHKAILAQPYAALGGLIKVTEQGEVIAQKYANPVIAQRNLEQLTTAVVWTNLVSAGEVERRTLLPVWERRIERLSDWSYGFYRELIFDTPGFLRFYEEATPIGVLKLARIGSRPAARGKGGTFEELRAIPWVFSWLQSRFIISAWYGLGFALERYMRQSGGLKELRQMNKQWAFFNGLMHNAQISLAKTDLYIAEHYANLVKDRKVRDKICGLLFAEYHRAVRCVLDVCEQKELLDSHPVLKRSIRLRNPYVDPLNYLQCGFLEEMRRTRRGSGANSKMSQIDNILLLTVNGIAFGMKSTG